MLNKTEYGGEVYSRKYKLYRRVCMCGCITNYEIRIRCDLDQPSSEW